MPVFSIRGDKAVQKAFRELEPKLARKVIRQAARKAAKPIQAATKRLAPIGGQKGQQSQKRDSKGRFLRTKAGYVGGQLRRAVKVRAMKRKKGRIGVIVQIGKGDFIGDQYYGAMVEFGTKRQKAQHYTERAFESSKGTALGTFVSEIRAGIEREAKS